MIRRGAILGLAVVFWGAVALAQTSLPALSEAQIRAEIIHRVMMYAGVEDGVRREGALAYRNDGTLLIRTRDGFADAGTWRITGGVLCTRIVVLRDSAETCFRIAPRPEGGFVTSYGYTLRSLGGAVVPMS